MESVDEFQYKHSMNGNPKTPFVAKSKQWVPVIDTNGSSYSGNQIIFDLSSLGADKFTSFAESFIMIPLTMTLTANNNNFGTTTGNDFALSLKNSLVHIFDNMSIVVNDSNINNNSPNSNLEMAFRLHQMGRDEAKNFQDVINYNLDTADSIRYTASGNENGIGEYNNIIVPTAFTPTGGYGTTTTQNLGRLGRQSVTSYNADRQSTISYYVSESKSETHYISGIHGATNTVVTHYIYAIVPLPVIHDFFAKVPLVRGMRVRLTLGVNMGSFTVTSTDATNFATYSYSIPHSTLPIMLSPIGGGFAIGTATSATGAISIKNDVTSCKFYACQYQLTADYEDQYCSEANRVHDINYLDYATFTITNLAAGTQYNGLLTPGMAKLRYLLMVPQLNSAANASLCSPMASAFSSAPATTCPYAKVSNSYQVQLNGSNIYDNALNYSVEHFYENLRPFLSSVNGGSLNSFGLTSGNLSKTDYERGYSFIFSNLAHQESDAKDAQNKAVQLVFNNNSNVAMDYFIVLCQEKNVAINCSNGQFV